MNNITVEATPYNTADSALRTDIAGLLNVIWHKEAEPQGEIPSSHRKGLAAQSFYCYSDNVLAGYAAVVHKQIFHCGYDFMLAGLSCVATHPDYRGCGIGRKVVLTATQYMQANKNIDFGIFTCHPNLAAFYKKAGDWKKAAGVVLLENHNEGALSSEKLNLAVLMRLFSEKAHRNKDLFLKEPISLNFSNGEFL